MRKHSTIGDFWEKPKRAIWQDVRDKEAKIAKGLNKPDVRRLTEHVYNFLGVCPSIPTRA